MEFSKTKAFTLMAPNYKCNRHDWGLTLLCIVRFSIYTAAIPVFLEESLTAIWLGVHRLCAPEIFTWLCFFQLLFPAIRYSREARTMCFFVVGNNTRSIDDTRLPIIGPQQKSCFWLAPCRRHYHLFGVRDCRWRWTVFFISDTALTNDFLFVHRRLFKIYTIHSVFELLE